MLMTQGSLFRAERKLLNLFSGFGQWKYSLWLSCCQHNETTKSCHPYISLLLSWNVNNCGKCSENNAIFQQLEVEEWLSFSVPLTHRTNYKTHEI